MVNRDMYLKMDDYNAIINGDGLYIVYDYTKKLKLPKNKLSDDQVEAVDNFRHIQTDLLLTIEHLTPFKKGVLAVLRSAKRNRDYNCTLKTSKENKTITIITEERVEFTYECEEVFEDINVLLSVRENIKLFNYLIGNELKIMFKRFSRGAELYFTTDGRMWVENLRYATKK